MAAELSLPYYAELVAVCVGSNISDIDRIVNSEFPGDKSSDRKPGKEFENGMSDEG